MQSGDCFKFVQLVEGVHDFHAVLDRIASQLFLFPDEERKVPKRFTTTQEMEEDYKDIRVKIRRFTRRDLAYWGEYGLGIEDLKGHESVQIYSVDRYWIEGRLSYINWGDLCFVYHFPLIDKVKIYTPYSEKRKWISNVPLNYMYGMENIGESCRDIIVTKSVKDYLVMSKIHECTCATQNESLSSITKENMELLKSRGDNIYIAFDSDNAGKRASREVTSTYEIKHLNIPDYLLRFGCTDFSDWCKRDGLGAIDYFLRCKL